MRKIALWMCPSDYTTSVSG